MTQLNFMEIDPHFSDIVQNEMMKDLSSERRERVQRYRSEIDRKIGIYAEVLVRCIICMRSGVNYKEISFKASRTGKPFLTGFPYYEFSISHTRNAVVAAVSDKPVGVDVERIRDIDIGITKRVFSDNELAALDTAPDKNLKFFELWTKKEALVKYHGTGLTNALKTLDVTGSLSSGRFESHIMGDYFVSICSGDECREIDFTRITEPELVEMWRNLTV